MLALLFMGILSLAFDIQQVEASGTIYISSDYTFTSNIYDTIIVTADNIIIDGAGYTVQGTGSGTGIDLSLRNNVTIKNVEVTNFHYGIFLVVSSNNTVTGNTASNNDYGILLWSSSNNTVTGNTASNNAYGIDLYDSSNNTVTGNTASNNSYGIHLVVSSNSTVTGNTASNNSVGIYLSSSSNNRITGNTASNNDDHGIYLRISSNNVLFHNNLIDNANNVEVSPANPNVLDNGIEGNYWSNYTGVDLNQDGIGDLPYVIDSDNIDNYPLMGMFHSFNTSVGEYVNVVSNSTIESFQHFESNSTIIIHVSNMTANQTHGFCRISIPYEVMSEPFNVTIDGANPTYWNYTLYDNGTHRWIYFEYQHTTREIVIIPEFQSFLILPLFMIAILLAVIIVRRKHRHTCRERKVKF